jgi:hypothetical protein
MKLNRVEREQAGVMFDKKVLKLQQALVCQRYARLKGNRLLGAGAERVICDISCDLESMGWNGGAKRLITSFRLQNCTPTYE